MQRLERDFHFFVPVDVAKSATLNEDGDWVFEGIASTSNMDLFGDVVYPDSFQKSIEFFKANGKIFYNHNYARKMPQELMEAQTPIGVPLDAKLTDNGLYIKAVLNKQHPLAQKIWKENLSNTDSRFNNIGLSIGAKALGPVERKYSDIHKRYVSVLPDLLLYEVSMTATPVNPETKTWISNNSFAQVMKSMIDEEDSSQSNVEYVQVKPDEVIVDSKNGLVVVKSTVQSEDGTTYVFEQTIDREEILKAMPEQEDKKPQEQPKAPEENTQEQPQAEETQAPETPESPVDGAPAEGMAEGQVPASPEEGASPEGGDAGGTPLDSLFGGDEGAAGGMPGAEGADGMPAGDGMEGAEAPQEDASMSLLIDKVDTLVEVMTTIAQDLAAERQSKNPGVESTETPPTPANDDILKSINDVKVELSSLTGDNLTTILKSVLTDSIKEIVTEVVRVELGAIVNQSVLKSADTPQEKVVVIRQPGVELASVSNEDGSKTVIKSVESGNLDIDVDVLKGLIGEYVAIKGAGSSFSSKRAGVLLKVEERLGISQPEFYYHVRRFEKGQL